VFTYIKAKNFKSLTDIKIDFNKTKTKTNKFVAIYGENGSGKTNIVELFDLLPRSIIARDVDVSINAMSEELPEKRMVIEKKKSIDTQRLRKSLLNLKDYRTIDEKEPTEIEYGFKINDKEGFYFIKFDDKIIEEKLYYMINKQRGYLFDIKKENEKIVKNLNSNIFVNSKYNEELFENIEKYWGKYSFLSLLIFELSEKNASYLCSSISENLIDVLENILDIYVHVDELMPNYIPEDLPRTRRLNNVQKGFIRKDELKEIQKYEEVLNIFFTQGYADVKGVKYKLEEREDKIYYELYFEKIIGGKIKIIPSSKESSGTKRILSKFDTLMGALLGQTDIIDEIDNGVHDLLMKNIIMAIKDQITGQLIITTHNTLLLEVLPKENIYILSTDYNGNKEINAISDYEIKVQKNHNARDLYLKGLFGGIPMTDYIDFEEIRYTLNETKDGEDIEET